jgi:hypothetical protein
MSVQNPCLAGSGHDRFARPVPRLCPALRTSLPDAVRVLDAWTEELLAY